MSGGKSAGALEFARDSAARDSEPKTMKRSVGISDG